MLVCVSVCACVVGIRGTGALELDAALGNSFIIIRLSKSSMVILAEGIPGSIKVSAA